MKELKIMKALRYILIVVSMLSVLSVSAQMLARLPEAEMHSTSAMVGSGSNLPSAAVHGVTTVSEQPNSARTVYGPRRERPGDNSDPYKDPLGDVVWPLMLCAGAFLIIRIARRKRAKIE